MVEWKNQATKKLKNEQATKNIEYNIQNQIKGNNKEDTEQTQHVYWR